MDLHTIGEHAANFLPHGHCYSWIPSLLWTFVISNTIIGLAYYSIPIALMVFVRKRKDLQFGWIFILFSAFIFACGTTHFMGVWTIWNPDYALDASVKAVTAGVSILTAALLWPLLPRALALPSPMQLRDVIGQREMEIKERQRAEVQLEAANQSLELRVAERTAALQAAEQQLQELLQKERLARVEAERASRMKDEFLMTLSHELRTPLSSIFGWAQLLKARKNDPAAVEQGVDVIDRNVRIQTKLIEDLLDMSAIVAGKVRLDVQPVDLIEVIDAALDSVDPALKAKEIRLEKVLDPSAGPVSGDAARLQQVLWNLLSNSAKYTPKGGKITVVLERVDSHIEFSVTDTGEGISPEFLPQLFERFSQADSSSKRRHGGLGLGLSIVKHLVEMHGGTIQARSRGVGQGATFIIALPLRASAEKMHGEHPAASFHALSVDGHLADLQGVRVVVIDDEKDARELVQTVLQDRGATVEVAASANEGLESVRHFNPTVVVCDIGMPGKDGYDFIRALRESGAVVPVLALTAFARPEDRIRAIKAGFNSHVAKPVEPAELITLVASLSGRL